MRASKAARGNALVVAVIVVLVMSVLAVGVIRFGSREVAGAISARKQAAASSCAEAARAWVMSHWNALDAGGPMDMKPVEEVLDSVTPVIMRGGHYGQVNVTGVQVIKLNPLTVGSAVQSNDLTNRIGDTATPFRVVVHCRQGDDDNARELEIEFGVNFGL
jgi:hypothetical protein